MKKLTIDRPEPNRLTGRNLAVGNILRQILEKNDELFSLAIYGNWGTGKTTVCRSVYNNLVSNLLAKIKAGESAYLIPVWFEAWRFQRESAIFPAILRSLGAEIAKNAKSAQALSYGKKLMRVSLSLLKAATAATNLKADLKDFFSGSSLEVGFSGEKFLNRFEAELEKVDESSLSQLTKIGQSLYFEAYEVLKSIVNEVKINGNKIRIVIFIDDLDRCLPDVAFEIIEQIKIWLDIQGYVICFALNKNEIENVVKEYFATHLSYAASNEDKILKTLSKEYLDKIISLGIYIDKNDKDYTILRKAIDLILDQNNEGDSIDNMKASEVINHLDNIINNQENIKNSKVMEKLSNINNDLTMQLTHRRFLKIINEAYIEANVHYEQQQLMKQN